MRTDRADSLPLVVGEQQRAAEADHHRAARCACQGQPLGRPGELLDPHKSTHTATAVDPATNADLGSIRIEATLVEYRRLIAWARRWPQRRWAVENADGLGRHLARCS
ncbi:hypothetical protein AB0M34_32250 [Nocardia sp. NPDC050193]